MVKRHRFLFCSLLLLIMLSLIIITKWKAWFYNVPEEKYQVSAIQDRIIMTPQEKGATGRCISWRYSTKLTSAYILLRKENSSCVKVPAEGEIVASQGGKAAYYKAYFSSLKSGCRYAYRIVNDKTITRWYYFDTPFSKDENSFIFAGDIQQENANECFYRFKDLLLLHPKIDCFVLSGDIMEHPTDRYWNCWYNAFDSVSSSVPILTVPGNHEYLKGLPQKLEQRWKRSFVYPSNGPRGAIGSSYYIDYPQSRMIMIDTQGINNPLSLIRHFFWLNKILKGAKNKWKIVVMHHPVYSTKKGRNNCFLRWTFRLLFEKYGVHLVLQGHDHAYARSSTEGSYRISKAPVYIVSVCSPKHYKIKKSKDFDYIGENMNLWQYILIRGDTLHYKAYRLNSNKLYDDIIILKNGVINGKDWIKE